MNAVARTLLLCTALISPLAHAGDVEGPTAPFEAVVGVMGGLALMLPAAYAGYAAGNLTMPPAAYCDQAGCDYGYPMGGLLGLTAGGLLGVSLGAGLGVAGAGALQGGAFHLGPALGGAAIGGLAGLVGTVTLGLAMGVGPLLAYLPLLVPLGTVVGAVTGAVWWYQVSLPFAEETMKAAPVVTLVPGGGVVGVAGAF